MIRKTRLPKQLYAVVIEDKGTFRPNYYARNEYMLTSGVKGGVIDTLAHAKERRARILTFYPDAVVKIQVTQLSWEDVSL